MRKILVLLMLFTVNSFAIENDMTMVNGKWDCSPEENGEMLLVNLIEYRTQDMSFIHDGKVTFILKGGLESILEIKTIGTFKFESNRVIEQIDSVDIAIIKDEIGTLIGTEESWRKAMLAETAPLITKSLNKNRWVQVNSVTNEITECKKR